MTRALKSVTAVLIVAGASRGPAQTHPDFSGTWTQNMEKSSKTSLQSYANRIEQKGETLTVTTVMSGARGESTYDRTYVIGKQSQSSDREGDRLTSFVKWEGQTLVFLTTEKEKAGTIETRETWTLSADGRTLTKLRTSHGPRGDMEQHYVLEKSLP
jgi:hypothetical protein